MRATRCGTGRKAPELVMWIIELAAEPTCHHSYPSLHWRCCYSDAVGSSLDAKEYLSEYSTLILSAKVAETTMT